MILDPNTSDGIPRIIDANMAACAAHGYTQEEFIGRPVADLDDEEGKLLVRNRTAEIMTGKPFYVENTHVRKDGSTFIAEVNAKRIDVRDGKPLILTTEYDITQRKRAEEKLKEKTEFLDTIIESAALSTWISDDKGTAIKTNKACLELFGAEENEVVGKYNLFKDTLIQKNGFMPDIKRVFQEGVSASFVIDYDLGAVDHVDVKGANYKTINSIFTPILDSSGTVSNVIVQTIDLTDVRTMESKWIQSQKMESIGNLAGGIAHEFNNMLAIIIGNNEIIIDDLPKNSLLRESADEIRIASLRARDVVKQLLTFSRQDNAVHKVLDLRFELEESIKLIRSSTPANIVIEKTLLETSYPIMGNSTQINQLLINICNNAIDAVPDKGGRITIDLSSESIDKTQSKPLTDLKPGRYGKLVVGDNGMGMDNGTLAKIFEPYFTTKDIGKGSGIGLAVVHGIVERHGATIIAESQIGNGTTITIFFPAHAEICESEISAPNMRPPTGDEHILFVDDEPSIAKLGKRLLESLGYTINSTTNPEKALNMVRADPDRFDLVISDMAMPNMTGDQMVYEIKEIRKDIPTILCTGYSTKISNKIAMEIGVSAFIMKPLDKSELAEVVRRVLDEARARGYDS